MKKVQLKKAQINKKTTLKQTKIIEGENVPPDKDETLIGKRVVVQTRRGQIIKGVYRGVARGDLYLTNAEVVGMRNRAKVDCIYIPLTNYGHMHPEPTQFIPNPDNT